MSGYWQGSCTPEQPPRRRYTLHGDREVYARFSSAVSTMSADDCKFDPNLALSEFLSAPGGCHSQLRASRKSAALLAALAPCIVQGKRNAASRLGQAIGQLARASMHMSEGEGPGLSQRATQRKPRKADGAVSADDVSSQASAASLTERRHLEVRHISPGPFYPRVYDCMAELCCRPWQF